MTLSLERAAAWSWRLLVCTAALALVGALLWYLRVIVLPVAVALTLRRPCPRSPRGSAAAGTSSAAVALALLTGLATVVALVAIATVSVVEQFDELRAAVSQAVDDIAGQLQDEPFRPRGASRRPRVLLGDAWREASGYAAAGVQTGAGIVAGLAWPSRCSTSSCATVPRSGPRSCAGAAPTSGPRSTVPAGARGTCSAASSAGR